MSTDPRPSWVVSSLPPGTAAVFGCGMGTARSVLIGGAGGIIILVGGECAGEATSLGDGVGRAAATLVSGEMGGEATSLVAGEIGGEATSLVAGEGGGAAATLVAGEGGGEAATPGEGGGGVEGVAGTSAVPPDRDFQA
jgi:hypothetical protein